MATRVKVKTTAKKLPAPPPPPLPARSEEAAERLARVRREAGAWVEYVRTTTNELYFSVWAVVGELQDNPDGDLARVLRDQLDCVLSLGQHVSNADGDANTMFVPLPAELTPPDPVAVARAG